MAAGTAPESRIFMRLFSCPADEKKTLQATVSRQAIAYRKRSKIFRVVLSILNMSRIKK